jgi:hypothetical protein
MAFTQAQLDEYKVQYPNDPAIQSLTLAEVNANTTGTVVDYDSVPQIASYTNKRGVVSDCAIAVGVVVFDTVLLAFGAAAVGKTATRAAATAMAEAVAPAMNALETIIARMGAPNASYWDKAVGFYKILSAIWDAGCFGAVLDAFLGALSWWEGVAYGIVGVATVVAIFATDGLALIAEIVLLLAGVVSLLVDIVDAVNKCSKIKSQVKPITDPAKPPKFAFAGGVVGALKTFSNNFVTIVKGGGLYYATNPIITNRTAVGPWEKFIPVSFDEKAGTFALLTADRHFVTACNGGGVGGPDDASAPVHTDATQIRDWEKLSFIEQPDGTYAIRTPKGYYLSANNGGGMNVHSGSQIMYTLQTQIGAWELFKFAA